MKKPHHIFHNKLWLFLKKNFRPHIVNNFSAYKDPVKKYDMKRILDSFITCFFIIILGGMWYFSTKIILGKEKKKICIYNIEGNEIILQDLRTNFESIDVAKSYSIEYQRQFPYYKFVIEPLSLKNGGKTIPRIFKIFYK